MYKTSTISQSSNLFEVLSSTGDKGESFPQKFSSNSNLDSSEVPMPCFFTQRTESLMGDMHIPQSMLSKLDPHKACKFNGIHAIVLK